MIWLNRRLWLSIVALAAVASVAVPSADAQRRWGEYRENQWEVMEERQVRPGARSVTLPAAGRAGARYEAIRVRVLDEPIFVDGLTVIYGNGTQSDIPIRRLMQAGETTQPIDLEGGSRFINEVRVNLRQDPDWRRTARVALLGDRDEARRVRDERRDGPRVPIVREDIPRNWVLFGTQRANFGSDRDIIQVGRERGRFEKIALRVRGNEVFVRDIIVRYGNGETQDYHVNEVVRPDYRTQELRLNRPGAIATIELIYASRPRGGQPAVVEVYGEYAAGSDRGSGEGWAGSEGWTLMGAKAASLIRNDRDVFPVDPSFGRINAIRLLARKSDVEIRSVTLTFASRETETIPVGRILRRDQATPDFPIRGRGGRGNPVVGITLDYKSVLSLRGEAVVEMWGRR